MWGSSMSGRALDLNSETRLDNEKLLVNELTRITKQRKKQIRFHRPQTAKQQRPEVREKNHRPSTSPFNNLNTVTRTGSTNSRNRKLNKTTSNIRIQVATGKEFKNEFELRQNRVDHFNEICSNSLAGNLLSVGAKFEKLY